MWGAPAQFRYVKGYSNRSGGVRKVFGFKNLISLSCNKCSLKGTLNSKYPTIFDVREYVFWISPECFLMS